MFFISVCLSVTLDVSVILAVITELYKMVSTTDYRCLKQRKGMQHNTNLGYLENHSILFYQSQFCEKAKRGSAFHKNPNSSLSTF